ncbi:MAG TPA: metal-sensitive transcriptional regulator [Anaerolineaceae bacterium]
MNLQDASTKEKMIQRLKRVEGQIRGIQGMVDEERDCREILQQLTAVRSAIQQATLIFMQEYTVKCLMQSAEAEPARREILLKDLFSMMDKV